RSGRAHPQPAPGPAARVAHRVRGRAVLHRRPALARRADVSALVEASSLAVWRGTRPVIHDVSLVLSAGDGVALVGPNAAGKSTLVRALAGLLPARRGEVRLDGRALREWTREAVARAVALVTTEDEGPGLLAVEDRVALGRYPHRGPF